MQIIITLAGHSRRFKKEGYKEHKFLIDINGKKMIEHVIDMFSDNDTFYFILNDKQVKNNKKLVSWLNNLTPNNHITIIKSHEKGPLHTVLQLKNIDKDNPIIISYCDFVVDWDYSKFKRDVYGYKCAIPAFKGFHPASYGNTYYAYMRVDKNNHLIELKEKKSFTKDRTKEYASSGIYYFDNWETFNKYSNIYYKKNKSKEEGYVSLIANYLVEDNNLVKVTEVDKFICFGTPYDLENYLFWSKYFYKNYGNNTNIIEDNKTLNIIPFAGKGLRFKSEFYRTKKPIINVSGKPMIQRACDSLPKSLQWIFIGLENDIKKYNIEKVIKKIIKNNVKIIQIKKNTDGQLSTCLYAKKYTKPNDSLLITSCDYEVFYNNKNWEKYLNDKTIDAAIWCIKSHNYILKNPNAFAYCKVDKKNRITKISEKKTISKNPKNDFLAIGVFWFRRASDFITMAEKSKKQNLKINNEYYVANSMNILLKENKKILVFEADQWISFGNPFELKVYEYWEEHFLQKK